MENNLFAKYTRLVACSLMTGGVLFGMSCSSYAEENPSSVSSDWLAVVAYAAYQTEYSGVFVYQYDNHVETSRITHLVGAGNSQYEKIESLDGPKREIIRHHGRVWAFSNDQMVQIDGHQAQMGFPALLTEQLPNLAANYQVIDAGKERIAGYNAQVILLQPKDNQRYAQKIWAHADSGLLLKTAVLGERNRVVEQYSFTQLQIGGNIDRSWLKSFSALVGAQHGKNMPVSNSEPIDTTKAYESGWVVSDLPNGFKKTKELLRPMRGKPVSVTQMVYSDGLSAISIFIEPSQENQIENKGLTSRGAVNLYRKNTGKHLITAVGEVPARVVMRVVDSVRYNGK